jgi:hypothetical protein
LPFISYKCPHCNALNGPHKEQKGCDSASTSGEGALQSQPYNPFSIQEMPRGIFIEEITPNHETTDPEMDAPVMIIRESPTIGGREELQSASTPDILRSTTVRRLPIGLSIEEMASNEETINTEMEPRVMIIPETPAAVTPLMVLEMAAALSVEEISPNDQQVEDHEAIMPIVFVQESPLAGSQVELPCNQNSANVAPVTVPEFPSGLSIEEMTPNQEMADPEMEPLVMIVRELPASGVPFLGDSSFITPLMLQEMESGLSIEEVSPNHQLTEFPGMDPPVMFVQESPSLGCQELLMSTPDPAAGMSIIVPGMPGFSVEELSPNQLGNEDCQMDPPVMIIQDSPSGGGPAAVTPLIYSDGSVRSPNDSVSWSTPGSSAITEYSVTSQDLSELGQEEINGNDIPASSRNESLQRYLHGNADIHGPVKTSAVTGQASLTGSHLLSENQSIIDNGAGGNSKSDSNSWRPAGSGTLASSSVTVTEIQLGMDDKLPSKSQQMNTHKMHLTQTDTNSNLPYSERETDSDHGSLSDVNEEEVTLDMKTRVASGGIVSGDSVRVVRQNLRNAEEQNELFTSTYDDSRGTNSNFRSSSWTSGVTESSTVSGDVEQWSEWQRSKEHLFGPNSGEMISDRLNLTTTGPTPVEGTQLIVGEMPPIDTGDGAEELEGEQQEGPRSSVSENSDIAEESFAGSEDYTGHDSPNHVGSVAYDRDKGSTSRSSRKGVGGIKKGEGYSLQLIFLS